MTVTQVEADLLNAKPLYVAMPVIPELTAAELQGTPGSRAAIETEDGNKPQPGTECCIGFYFAKLNKAGIKMIDAVIK
jgi:hypothetical protein